VIAWAIDGAEPSGRLDVDFGTVGETTRRRVMSHSLVGADRPTQWRVIGVALVAAFVFITALIAARFGDPDGAVVASGAPTVVKAEKATSWTHRETTGSVR
jgi:hypothetical protein